MNFFGLIYLAAYICLFVMSFDLVSAGGDSFKVNSKHMKHMRRNKNKDEVMVGNPLVL